MLDIVTVVGVLSTAHKTLTSMFAAGRDIEQCAGDLHRWITAAQDLDQHEKEVKRPTTFAKVFKSGAIEKQAIAVFAARKKVERQRLELKNFILANHGLAGWNELLALESKIRRQRTEAIYAQREFKSKIIECIMIVLLASLSFFALFGLAYVVSRSG